MSKRTVILSGVGVLGLTMALIVTWPRASLSQAGGPELWLYSEENFTGRAIRVLGTVLDMPAEENLDGTLFEWNDNVKSLVVMGGTWRLYQHGRLNTQLDDTPVDAVDVRVLPATPGWSALVSAPTGGTLEVPNLQSAGLALDISSIEFLSTESLPSWSSSLRGRN